MTTSKQPLNVTVLGAGLMGHGIAQVFACAGHRVVVTDPDATVLGEVHSKVAANLALSGTDAGNDAASIVARIFIDSQLASAVSRADLVIEAAPERLALKQRLFLEVAAAAPEQAILASNTSVIPITQIGEVLSSQARTRLVGTHWWNPPHLVPLVEVVRTQWTSEAVFQQTFDWLLAVGKLPVKVQRDVTGFIGNRLQHAMWREAIGLIEDGVCDGEAIDLVVKNSFGLRLPVLGPIENADLVGLELTRDVHRVMFPALRQDTVPSKLLDELLEQGHTGMKSGEGLRRWTPAQVAEVQRRLAEHLINSSRR